jgi:DNA-binding NarL/FixJ family response regulator
MSYLVKPVGAVQLIPAIETALKRSRDLQGLLDERNCLEEHVQQLITELSQIKEESAEVNTALKVVIKLRASDSADAKKMLIHELQQEVMPFLQKTKNTSHDRKQTQLLSTLDANLQQLIASYGSATSISSAYKQLTPREIQVASMVRNGVPTKTIAATLSLSPETVSIHRTNIRKKLGLDNKADNLRSKLMSMN